MILRQSGDLPAVLIPGAKGRSNDRNPVPSSECLERAFVLRRSVCKSNVRRLRRDDPLFDSHAVADVPSAATKTPRPACFATSGLMRAQTGSTADSLRLRSRLSTRRPGPVYRRAKKRFRFRRWTPTAHPPAFVRAFRTADLTLYDGLNKRASSMRCARNASGGNRPEARTLFGRKSPGAGLRLPGAGVVRVT